MADIITPQGELNLSTYFPKTPTKADFLAAGIAGSNELTREQANLAYRAKYGQDAPDALVSGVVGSGVAGNFWERVQRGDFSRNKSSDTKAFMETVPFSQARQQQMEAVRPGAEIIAGQYPEITADFARQRQALEAEKNPLVARYDNLIAQINGRGTSAINRQSIATQGELGRRGISGGLADQTLANALNPIESEYAGLVKDTGFERERSLRDLLNQIAGLTTQETSAKRGVLNSIAGLLTGAGQAAIPQAQQAQQFDYQKEQDKRANDIQERAAKLAERQFNEVTLPQSKAKASSSLTDLWSAFGF